MAGSAVDRPGGRGPVTSIHSFRLRRARGEIYIQFLAAVAICPTIHFALMVFEAKSDMRARMQAAPSTSATLRRASALNETSLCLPRLLSQSSSYMWRSHTSTSKRLLVDKAVRRTSDWPRACPQAYMGASGSRKGGGAGERPAGPGLTLSTAAVLSFCLSPVVCQPWRKQRSLPMSMVEIAPFRQAFRRRFSSRLKKTC